MKPHYVHLYFDFDGIHSKEEYDDVVVKWLLESVSDVFGNYSVGGYTNNEEMAALGFKFMSNAKKHLSIHVVYYITMIDVEELVSNMKYTDKFIN